LNGYTDTGERQMPTYNTTINGHPVTITADVTGKYYPATRDEPEEFPEVEITGVWCEHARLPDPFYVFFVKELNEIECAIQCGDLEPIGAED
jgi:hypothetical protein